MHVPSTRRWQRAALAATAIAATAVSIPAAAHATAVTQAEIDTAVAAGAAWIADQQDKKSNGTPNPAPTGGFQGFNANWAINSLAAGGIHPADVHKPGVPLSVQQYVQSWYQPGGSYAGMATLPGPGQAGDYGREALIASAAGLRVNALRSDFNLVASLASRWRPAQGDFGSFTPNHDGFVLLAAKPLQLPAGVRAKIVANLLRAQKTGTTLDADGRFAFGGWSYSASSGGNGDIDVTGAVLSMLCQEGMTATDPLISRGVDFLHRRLNPETGGFGVTAENYVSPSNAPGSAWAVLGLRTCGVDLQTPKWTTPNGKNPLRFLLDLQRTDPGVPAAYGSFRYQLTTGYPSGGNDLNSTEAAVRALAGTRWYVPPPERADTSAPRWLPTPEVADGTPVPIALAVDPGNGDVRFCGVRVPAGSRLGEVLEIARTTSVPSGCVDEWSSDDGAISGINGQPGTGWRVRIGDADPVPATDQRIGLGAVVTMELSRALAANQSRVDFPSLDRGAIGPAQAIMFTATADDVTTGAIALDGDDVEDFIVARNGCDGVTLDAGESCTVLVRFAPGVAGTRQASLGVRDANGEDLAPRVDLRGEGRAPAPPVPPVVTVIAPPSVPAPPTVNAPTPKVRSTTKARTKKRAPAVVCRITGKRVKRFRCTVAASKVRSRSVAARLTRRGQTYATGRLTATKRTTTLRAKRTKQRLRAGRYTLRLDTGKRKRSYAVRIR